MKKSAKKKNFGKKFEKFEKINYFFFITVLLGLRKMEHFYMLGCQKIPTWLKTKIDVLKIPVLLHKAQDLLEDILEKLENLPSSTEVEDVR